MKIYRFALAGFTFMTLMSSCSAVNNFFSNKKNAAGPALADTETLVDKASYPDLALLAGEWQVASVGETEITAEENVPYVNFDVAQGRFYADNGCNIVNGSFVYDKGWLTCSGVISTMKYCVDVPYEAEFNSAFNPAPGVEVASKRIGQETYLYLNNSKGVTLVTLRKHNMEFLNGNWQVASINGKAIDDEEATVFFDIAELKIHGNTGCNYFNGQIYIDPNRSNAIDLSNMGMTRMACPKSGQEQAMMVALESAATAISGGNGATALLLDKSGKEVMTIKRIADRQEK